MPIYNLHPKSHSIPFHPINSHPLVIKSPFQRLPLLRRQAQSAAPGGHGGAAPERRGGKVSESSWGYPSRHRFQYVSSYPWGLDDLGTPKWKWNMWNLHFSGGLWTSTFPGRCESPWSGCDPATAARWPSRQDLNRVTSACGLQLCSSCLNFGVPNSSRSFVAHPYFHRFHFGFVWIPDS